MVFDTHLHLWNPDTIETPWRQGWGRFAPRPAFSAEDALRALDDADIERAALVPTEWDRLGTELVGAAAARYPDRFVAFGSVSLREPLDAGAIHGRCVANDLAGLRQIFVPTGGASLVDDARIAWLWDGLAELAVPVMVWAPGQLDELARVVGSRPGLYVVVDHLNLPMRAGPSELDAEVEGLCRLARHAGTAVKISALTCALAGGLSPDDLRRALRRLVDAFGTARVFWGSDLTRTPEGYEGELAFVRGSQLSEDEAAGVLGASFAAWLDRQRLPPPIQPQLER